MKRLFFSFALMVVCGLTASAGDYNYLTIMQADTPAYGFALRTVKKITFSGDIMTVQTIDGTTTGVALSTLQQLSFEADRPVGIRQDLTSANRTPIYIYHVNGQLIRHFDGTQERGKLNLSDLPQGIYILKQGTETRKILKQ